jgi:hypothetical protein
MAAAGGQDSHVPPREHDDEEVHQLAPEDNQDGDGDGEAAVPQSLPERPAIQQQTLPNEFEFRSHGHLWQKRD